MTELTDDELLIIWRFNFAKTNRQRFLDIARAAIAADRDLTATLAEPVAEPAAAKLPSDEELRHLWSWAAGQDQGPWPTQYHCFALAVLARWGRPTPPAPPAEGEIDQLVSQLRDYAQGEQENGWHDDAARFRRAAELLERHAAPVPVPGVAHTRYEFSVCDETGMEVAGGSAPTYAQALSEGRHYLAQYQQDEPHTLELRRVEVLDPDALPLPAPQGEEVE